MNSTTTPTLRDLAAAAYREKIERDAAAKAKELRLYREHLEHDFNGYLAGIFREEEKTYQVFAFSWDEGENAPIAQCDGLTFVPMFADDDTTMNGVALQTKPGWRHQIESLADLGAILQDQEIAADNAVWNLQHPDAPHNAPPMSETHPKKKNVNIIMVDGKIVEIFADDPDTLDFVCVEEYEGAMDAPYRILPGNNEIFEDEYKTPMIGARWEFFRFRRDTPAR
jgi:hypothetical protein